MSAGNLRDRIPFQNRINLLLDKGYTKPWHPGPSRGEAFFLANQMQKQGRRDQIFARGQDQGPKLQHNGRWKPSDEERKLVLARELDEATLAELLKAAKSLESPIWKLVGRGEIFIVDKTLVLEVQDPLTWQNRKSLQRIFAKRSKCGFLEWLSGAKGWRIEGSGSGSNMGHAWVKDFVVVLNHLQGVHKMFAPKEQRYIPDSNNQLVWKKRTTLQDCVSDVRVWLETLTRSPLTNALFRTSAEGPDSLLHWSHHHPKSTRFNLTVITRESMADLVNGIIRIFQWEFAGKYGKVALGDSWAQKQPGNGQEWTETIFIVWNKDKLESLLNGEEKFCSVVTA